MDRWTIGSTGDGCFAATIEGDLDLANGRHLVKKLEPLLRSPGSRVEVDLSGVDFIDSSGLQALMTAHRSAVEKGCVIVLVALSPRVESLLDLTGCADLFNVIRRQTQLPRVLGSGA